MSSSDDRTPGPPRPGYLLRGGSDRIFAAAIALLALGYIWSASDIQVGFLSDPVGSRTFPFLVGGLSLLCALVIFIRPDKDPCWPGKLVIARIAMTLAILYVFAISLRPVGFIIPAALASAAISFQIHPNWKTALMSGLGLSAGLFLVFKYGLGLGLAPFGRLITG